MKTKKIKNRLTLNKKTIARLNGMEMDNLRGGGQTTVTIAVSVCHCETDEHTNCIHSCPSIFETCYCNTYTGC